MEHSSSVQGASTRILSKGFQALCELRSSVTAVCYNYLKSRPFNVPIKQFLLSSSPITLIHKSPVPSTFSTDLLYYRPEQSSIPYRLHETSCSVSCRSCRLFGRHRGKLPAISAENITNLLTKFEPGNRDSLMFALGQQSVMQKELEEETVIRLWHRKVRQ